MRGAIDGRKVAPGGSLSREIDCSEYDAVSKAPAPQVPAPPNNSLSMRFVPQRILLGLWPMAVTASWISSDRFMVVVRIDKSLVYSPIPGRKPSALRERRIVNINRTSKCSWRSDLIRAIGAVKILIQTVEAIGQRWRAQDCGNLRGLNAYSVTGASSVLCCEIMSFPLT